VAAIAQRAPATVFVGFMGAGKSRSARRAKEAGLQVADTDALLETELGTSIAEFFERHGEQEFRGREAELATAVLDQADGGAIALGGGAVLAEPVRRALDRHMVAWLDVPVEVAWQRVSTKEHRPLARDRDSFERLYEERRPLYEEVADARMLWGESASGSYPVFVGRGLLGQSPWPVPGRAFLITDSSVGVLHGGSLSTAGGVEVEPGEGSKTLAVAERVLRELTGLGVTRSDHLVALGGGVVGDLAGFCAATYQRGIRVVQVPTTLVGQVDSAYGGKTGVDLPEAKNYVGAYHLPAMVMADPATLDTLPQAELRAGFVEVVKTALLAGGELWERVRAIDRIEPRELDDVIYACARYKVDVVAADERDAGRRQVLNLGHTVGHAIEAAGGYGRHRHGEAVGLGLLAALRLSGADDLREEVRTILVRHELPVELDERIDVDLVMQALERDKKRDGEGVAFVLLERPGEPSTGVHMEPSRVRGVVDELQGSDR
jgi:3-dehydroquinate synthase